MSVLMIGVKEQAAIDAAIERARRRPLPLAVTAAIAAPEQNVAHVTLANRQPNVKRPKTELVAIPADYFLCVSFEEHPAGMCLHISISLRGERAKQALAHPAAIEEIARVCGIPFCFGEPNDRISVWIEEFEEDGRLGGNAVNLIYVTTPAQEGHA